MPNDDVRLIVSGREFTGWTGVNIEFAIDTAADGFAVSAPFDPDLPEIRDTFRPFEYQPTEVYIGDEKVITGKIDVVHPKTDAGDRSLMVEGRSKTGILADCSIVGDLERSGLALSTICKVMAEQRYGIRIVAENDTNPIDVARAEYGQKIYAFLDSLAAPRGLLLSSDRDGNLVIFWARRYRDRAPVATLEEGKAPLLSVDADFDGTKRYSKYTVATQFAGEPDIVGSVDDQYIRTRRPVMFASPESIEEAVDGAALGKTAARKRTEAFVQSIKVSATLTGWRRPDGRVWQKGDAVSLRAPGAMLYRESRWIAAGVSLKIDAQQGRVTTLRLVQPETYAGVMPEVQPWA